MPQYTILYVAPEITIPGTHGGSTHAQEAIESFARLGHRVILLSKKQNNLRRKEKKGNLIIYRVPIGSNSAVKNITYLFWTIMLVPFFIQWYNVDVVYERARIGAGWSILFARVFHRKSVYELNEPLESMGEGYSIFRSLIIWWGRWIAEKATIVTGSDEIFFKHIAKKNTLLVDYGANPEKFTPKISAGEIIEKYGLTQGKVVFYSGSFAPWHHMPIIIRSARQVIKKDKKVKYLLVGTGNQYALAKQMIHRLNLTKNVILGGAIPYQQMPQYVNTATITLAIFDESHPMIKKYGYFYSPIKIHEYKAAGKPIIASNIGNLKKYVKHGKNGYLVSSENLLKELTKYTQKLLKNKKQCEEMGKINRNEIVHVYNWDVTNKKIIEALAQK
ncbi:MAG: glycosyltransferase [Nanoarchaeota archaeon]